MTRKKSSSMEDLTTIDFTNSTSDPPQSPTKAYASDDLAQPSCSSDCRDPKKESSSTWLHHVDQKIQEVFQLKQGHYSDLSPAKSSGIMNLNSLDNAPTQALLSLLTAILCEMQNEIPPRVKILVRKIIQESERRFSTQSEQIKKLKNALRVVIAREERLISRQSVLETLATGKSDEFQIVTDQLQKTKTEKTKMEEKKKLEEQEMLKMMKEKDDIELAVQSLKDELETTRKEYEQHCLQLETLGKEAKMELDGRVKDLEFCLTESRKKIEELEAFSDSKIQSWKRKDLRYRGFIGFQFQALQELRMASQSVKQEILNAEKSWLEEFNNLGGKLRGLADAAENYHTVLAENRKLYNEVQDLKGNIRVYCRVRPFLVGEAGKQTTIEYIGDNGELLVVNPNKQGRDGHRMFKFNKVFGPTATQEEVFLDTQPLIRSVLDGYNVCIFAYGQTGSGKTFTMSGPDASIKENWGVNYRALNDLFHISRNRRSTFIYEVGVQMVEIYNEQVRDLLKNDGSQKRLGILSTCQPNGLAVPDATMCPVKSTTDVLELMQIGHMNRAVGATALNERSSRSHSILTVHVRGSDLETGAALRGSLHLVDLAGSERVDRSEVTGDRLREAQHINKSLSALGDVISALAQKSSHVPYRNSKLTQILQASLGGQAKTLMFVQLNPDLDSYSETVSTLKFAERVSGVELGAARSNKESKDVRELMDQVASLKETVARKDAEIERLQILKDLRSQSPEVSNEKRSANSSRQASSSPSRHSVGGPAQRAHRLSVGKAGPAERAASDLDNCSEYSDKQSEAGSHQSMDDFGQHKEYYQQSKLGGGANGENFPTDVELLGFGDADSEERLSDISDGGLSMGTETDGSISSIVEFTLFPEATKPGEGKEKRAKAPTRIPRPPPKPGQTVAARTTAKDLPKRREVVTSSKKVASSQSGFSPKPSSKRWQ